MFIYPTIQMVQLSFTKSPLIGAGEWIGFDNYIRMFGDRVFWTAVWNTSYFVLLTVVPGTAVALCIALMVSRLKGWVQSVILAAFFLPFILPVTVVYLIWDWMLNLQFGIAQYLIEPLVGQARQRLAHHAMVHADGGAADDLVDQRLLHPAVPRRPAQHSARTLRGGRARRRHALAVVRQHHLAADLAGDGAVPDHPAHPAAEDLRPGVPVRARAAGPMPRWCWCSTSTSRRSRRTRAAMPPTIAVALFVIVVAFSVLQFQLLRMRGSDK